MDLTSHVSKLHNIKDIQRKIYVLVGYHIEIYVCIQQSFLLKKNKKT